MSASRSIRRAALALACSSSTLVAETPVSLYAGATTSIYPEPGRTVTAALRAKF